MNKKIAFFDIETTGTDISLHRIIQFAAKIYLYETTGITLINSYNVLINPGPGIEITNSEIHHITNEMVSGEPEFKHFSGEIIDLFSDCDLSGFNIKRFDVPFLLEEMNRAGADFRMEGRRIIDPFILYKILNPQSLAAAYKKYCGTEIEGAHDALSDVTSSAKVYEMMIRNGDIPTNPDDILKMQNNGTFDPTVDFAGKLLRTENGGIVFNFGQHKGKSVYDNLGYLDWMIRSNFTADTKKCASDIINSQTPLNPFP